MSLHISGINYESFSDSEGVSCVIFFSGCQHNCAGCHSLLTHDFNYGIEVTDKLINTINNEIDKRPFLNSLVLSGGDPMYSAKEILELLPKIHVPKNNIWCFSGFTLNEIQNNQIMNMLLNKCNVLVDGMFDIGKRDITLAFRGSYNQNIWRKNTKGEWLK